MNLETKIIIYKFTPQVFTLTQLNEEKPFREKRLFLCGVCKACNAVCKLRMILNIYIETSD